MTLLVLQLRIVMMSKYSKFGGVDTFTLKLLHDDNIDNNDDLVIFNSDKLINILFCKKLKMFLNQYLN